MRLLPLFLLSIPIFAQPRPVVSSVGPGETRPYAWIKSPPRLRPALIEGSRFPLGFWPQDMRVAYGIQTTGGAGTTVAIVDAYDAPNIAADLAVFSAQFGISCPGFTFQKLNQNGAPSPLPVYNAGWELEITLDVEWVHAVAPCAKIILVESTTNGFPDQMTSVATGERLASVVSMSWGGPEWPGQTLYDPAFIRTGVTFLASSGDAGGTLSYPASSPLVIGVGATQLTPAPGGGLATSFFEMAWSGSGGGCSVVESSLPFQVSFLPVSPACSMRGAPDVSMSGGDQNAVATYCSLQGGWGELYGTSLSVQMYAGIIAVANGVRGPAAPLSGTLGDLYLAAAAAPSSALYNANFRDITSGTAGAFTAGPGWDFITGLGSPIVTSLMYQYLGNYALATAVFPTTALAFAMTAYSTGIPLTSTANVLNTNLPVPSGGIGSPPVIESNDWILLTEQEAMCVDWVAGRTVNARRGCQGTYTQSHVAGSLVWTGPAYYYHPWNPPVPTCVATQQYVLPWITLPSGNVWDCTGGIWTLRAMKLRRPHISWWRRVRDWFQ